MHRTIRALFTVACSPVNAASLIPRFGRGRHIERPIAAAGLFCRKGNAAGIIDEADYAKMPDKGGTILLGTVSKDQFRILHRLMPMPEMAVIASEEADPALVEKARDYFLKVVNQRPLSKIRLNLMGIKGFAPATPGDYEAFTKWYNSVCPPETPVEFEESAQTQTSSAPAATPMTEGAVPMAP